MGTDLSPPDGNLVQGCQLHQGVEQENQRGKQELQQVPDMADALLHLRLSKPGVRKKKVVA